MAHFRFFGHIRHMAQRTPVSDTAPDALAIHAKLVASFTLAERAQRVSDLTLGANMVALSGLRHRHPRESEQELLLRLAALRLGDDVVERVYGRRAPDDS